MIVLCPLRRRLLSPRYRDLAASILRSELSSLSIFSSGGRKRSNELSCGSFSSLGDGGSSLTKSDLACLVSEDHGLTHAASRRIVDGVFDAIADSVVGGRPARISGFGTFDTAVTGERAGRNPHTGESIIIPETRRVRFRPHQALRDSVKGQRQK
uniref:Integration host factor subunit alpha n=1 Tax=Trieres chinensis TaxID=1514140 RepID=A0A7S1YU55_TRICV|mmetsp:Transcript_10799/g.22629  ORF Transcript_10799/g.22629 Transcript_10799/m.22629 type:complete len:155 (+) Transcript_10799:34-498(+)